MKLHLILTFLFATQTLFAAQSDPGTVSGRVLSPTGAGVGGAELVAYTRFVFDDAYSAISAPDGSFTISVPAGYSVVAFRNNAVPGYFPPSVLFDVSPGTNITGVELKLLAPDAIINGTMRSPTGAPVEGIRVDASRVENQGLVNYDLNPVTTDANGNFTITASKGHWFVSGECGDLASQSFDCSAGKNIDITNDTATVNFFLTTGPQPTIESPRFQITRFPESDFFEARIIFTLRGAPGGYYIQASSDIRRYDWRDYDWVSIPVGASSVEVNTVINTFPQMPTRQFFRAWRHSAPPE